MIRFLCILIFGVLFTFSTDAQSIRVTLADTNLLIGESTTLTLKVESKPKDSIRYFPKQNQIDARLFSGKSVVNSTPTELELTSAFWDTTLINTTSKTWLGKYTITAWDSGLYLIPGQEIYINDSLYRFNDIKINFTLVAKVDSVDIYDIYENYADVPANAFSITKFLKNNWWWMALILIAGIIYYFYRLNKKAEELPKPERKANLKDRTLIAIEALERERLWEQDRLKEHFVELSYILRNYLTSRYEISLLEKTTYQAKILLLQKGLNEETVDTIIRILFASDMVKFAKSEPDELEILKVSAKAKQVVAETSPIEIEGVE